ncbi:hypothetical protein Q8A73_012445 [Channa argus]|nr:hypothetical protein Q8A73_012445 [Channa argus]
MSSGEQLIADEGSRAKTSICLVQPVGLQLVAVLTETGRAGCVLVFPLNSVEELADRSMLAKRTSIMENTSHPLLQLLQTVTPPQNLDEEMPQKVSGASDSQPTVPVPEELRNFLMQVVVQKSVALNNRLTL